MPPLDRDQFIALLHRLSSTDDTDVLAAARAIRARMHEAGTSWEALLAPAEERTDTGAEEAPRGDAGQEPEAAHAAPAGAEVAEDLGLIEKLMRDKNLSADTRDILEDLRADFRQGDATEADRRYLRALAQRVGRRG